MGFSLIGGDLPVSLLDTLGIALIMVKDFQDHLNLRKEGLIL